MKFYFVAVNQTVVCFLAQCKGFRILVDPFGGVPPMFDVASIDLVLISNVAGSGGLQALKAAAGFRAAVLTTEATALLGGLGNAAQRVSFGQRVVIQSDVIVEALSSGYMIGAANWKLSLWGRIVSFLGPSSLVPNRHPLPFNADLVEGCDLLVSAVARVTSGIEWAKVSAELRSLCSAGPVVLPCSLMSSPVFLDLLDVVRELQPLPAVSLIAKDARAFVASVTVLAEFFDSTRLARVHNADNPLALVPQLLTDLSLPLQGRSQQLFFTDDLPAVLAALGPSLSVLACDPAASFNFAGARVVPLEVGLSAPELRAMCQRAPRAAQLSPSSPFPVRVVLAGASRRSCLASLPPGGSRVSASPADDGAAVAVTAAAAAPTAEQLARALRRAGVGLMKWESGGPDGRSFAISLPTMQARIQIDAQQRMRVDAESRDNYEMLSRILNNL